MFLKDWQQFILNSLGTLLALLEWTDENLIISDLGTSFPLHQHALVIFQVDEACKPVSTMGP